MNEQEMKIAQGFDFVTIAEPKFKTNTIEAVFMLPSCKENNAALSLLQQLLTDTSKAYPTLAAMSKKLGSLYGASLRAATSKRGDVIQMTVGLAAIDNRYAAEQEDLLAEITSLLIGCLLAPNAENGAFNDTMFRIAKQDLLDSIDAAINDKRAYSADRAKEEAFAGEPFAYPTDGKREDAEQLTAESVYAAYHRLLETAVIRVYHVGPAHAPQIGEQLKASFAGITRNPVSLTYETPSPCKDEVYRVTEPISVTQSKLVLVFKGTAPKRYAMNLMNEMFGASPFSMLFNNVREKMSLCYYCSSAFLAAKQSLFVSSGVELENAEKTYNAIHEQLDAIRSGSFEDEILENARRSALEQLYGMGDSPNSFISWSHRNFCDSDPCTVAELIENYKNLTRQDVIDAANALQEDTVYLMQQEVQHEESN